VRQRVITAVVALAFFLPIIYVGGIAVELLAAAIPPRAPSMVLLGEISGHNFRWP
jgi:hypothetical protein